MHRQAVHPDAGAPQRMPVEDEEGVLVPGDQVHGDAGGAEGVRRGFQFQAPPRLAAFAQLGTTFLAWPFLTAVAAAHSTDTAGRTRKRTWLWASGPARGQTPSPVADSA